jgi:hypothetical protein
VSLLSRDQLIIGLSPNKLTALRLGGRLRQRVHERHAAELQSTHGAQWDPLMTALENLLDQPVWVGRDLTFVLSNHYVRYAVIPGGKGLSIPEQNELARLVFRNIYGDLSSDWEIRISPSSEQSTLASAVPRSFLKTLHDICDGRGRLRSIQPLLMAVFNRARGLIKQKTVMLVVVESGRISLAGITDDRWQSFSSRAAGSDALITLLADECELQGRAPSGALWLCDLTREVQLPVDAPWHVQRLWPHPDAANSSQNLADWGVQ